MSDSRYTPYKPVSVGDMVQVVKPNNCPRCEQPSLGKIFQVTAILPAHGTHWSCTACGFRTPHNGGTKAICGDNWSGDIRRLKRIPPPSELGIVDEKVEESHPLVTGDLETQRAIHDR